MSIIINKLGRMRKAFQQQDRPTSLPRQNSIRKIDLDANHVPGAEGAIRVEATVPFETVGMKNSGVVQDGAISLVVKFFVQMTGGRSCDDADADVFRFFDDDWDFNSIKNRN